MTPPQLTTSDTHSPADVVHGSRLRCASCAISMHVMATPAPSVCPYCKRKLDRTQTSLPVAEPFPAPGAAEVEARIGKLYSRPNLVLALLIGAVALLLLAWAVFLQLRNADNYYYQGASGFSV